jgi:hypothetical protein
MASLTPRETRYVRDSLRSALQRKGGGRLPPMNRVAVQAVPVGGTQYARDRQRRERGRLQRALARLLTDSKPPRTIRVDSFDQIVRGMDRYDSGLGERLRKAVALARYGERKQATENLPRWFDIATREEWSAFIRPRTAPISPNPKSARFQTSWGMPRWVINPVLDFVEDAEKAGINRDVAWLVSRRLIAPFCGHRRSGGQLLGWHELATPGMKDALRSAIRAERIWLGITAHRLRPRVQPLAGRIEKLSLYGWDLGSLERLPQD